MKTDSQSCNAKIVVFIRMISAVNENRVIKEALSIKDKNLKPYVVYWERMDSNAKAQIIDGINAIPIFVGKAGYRKGLGSIKHRFLAMKQILKKTFKLNPCIIHSCDMDAALIGIIYKYYKKLKENANIKLIYDIFDFLYLTECSLPNLLKFFLRKLDLVIMLLSDSIIVPDENRIHLIPTKFRKKTLIVTNAPKLDINDNSTNLAPFILSKIGKNQNQLTIFYAGTLSSERGIEFLLEAIEEISNFKAIIAGAGELEKTLVAYKSDKLVFLGKIKPQEVYSIYPYIDIVYVMYNPKIPQNQFSSPTKLFEALSFNKPVIISKGIYWDEVIEKHKCGWVCDYNKSSLVSLLRKITRSEVKKKSLRTTSLSKLVNWQNSEKKLLTLYSKLKAQIKG